MKVTDLKNNEVIHCSTKEEYDAISQLLHDAGKTWCNRNSYIEDCEWNQHQETTCLQPKKGTYARLQYFKDKNITIYPASKFLTQFNEELIEQLTNGEIALDYSDSEDIESLKLIINKAFPDNRFDELKGKTYNCHLKSSHNTGWGANYEIRNNRGKPLVKLSQFLIQSKNSNMSKFPFTLRRKDAIKIINASCSEWKPKLTSKWSDLVFADSVEITKEYYTTMRKACNTVQNTLFDKIFGVEDNNAMLLQKSNPLQSVSSQLFNDKYAIQLGERSCPEHLKMRCIFVNIGYNVEIQDTNGKNNGKLLIFTKK